MNHHNNDMPKKILFIEDEGALQQAAGYMLEREGFTVLSALDGDAGLRVAKDERPDLILLDLVLPKRSGFEVLKALKTDPELGRTPVIILSNLESNDDINKALELGGTTYLLKSNYRLEEVIEKIKNALGETQK